MLTRNQTTETTAKALGTIANGDNDDVVGFTRGFLYAGANSIVSSLWKIDDEATGILIVQFYQNLAQTDKRVVVISFHNQYLAHLLCPASAFPDSSING